MADWSFLRRAFYRLARFIVPRFIRAYFRYEAYQLEDGNIFPEGTPVIFAMNHRSHLDALILASALVAPYGSRTQVAMMASGKAMQSNWFFGLMRFLGAFPVFQENPEPALAFARKSLKRGIGVVIAPQGKRIRSTPYHDYFNLTKEGKNGVGRLVLAFNGKVPVVPAYIRGSAEALSLGRFIPRFGSPISVSFGPPMYWSEYTRRDGWKQTDSDFFSTAREIADKIMNRIRDQLLIQEKDYFALFEQKFGKKTNEISIPNDLN
ncbi:MAG: lysophospholipid acyltransferase family protein [Candidatus Hodarchaeales archaeon]|jgi:1-acyl-sn-glycerol-3-phosphate acyltransferase